MNPPNPRGHRRARATLPALVATMLLAATTHAGQVRIDATANNLFADSAAVINPGDQVVWVSTGGIHTVTSGTVDGSGNTTPDGRFGSPNISSSANGCFAWRSSGTGSVPYYCTPHAKFGMVARLKIVTTGTPVSDFRITEVRWTTAHDHDFVEIANLGDASGNLGLYRLSLDGRSPVTLGVQSGQPTLRDIVVPSDGRVVVNLNQGGTNTATQMFVPGVTIGPSGSAALYCATTYSPDTAMTSTTLIVDYVQWGASGWRNESTANTAGLWNTGDLAPAVADGHSIEFCGTRADHGASFWQGSPTPTPGGVNCVSPVISTTWGRIKTLYR